MKAALLAGVLAFTACGIAAAQTPPPQSPPPSNPFAGMLQNFSRSLERNDAPTAAPGPLLPGQGVSDLHCEQDIVDGFAIEDNFASLMGRAMAGAARGVVGFFQNLGDATLIRNEMLKEVRSAARTMNWLPLDLELKLGEVLHAEQKTLVRRDSKEVRDKEDYRALDAAFAQLAPLVPAGHPYAFQLFLRRDDDHNAEAAPGGYIYVSRSALPSRRQQNDAKARAIQVRENEARMSALRFMLMHEIAHVLRRHQTREIQGRIVDSLDTVDKVRKLFHAVGHGPEPLIVLGAVKYLVDLHTSYSPDQEKQADACALRLLAPLGPEAGDRAFRAFMDRLPLGDGAGGTHPKTGERMQHGLRVVNLLRAR